jgi:hypothetical protein
MSKKTTKNSLVVSEAEVDTKPSASSSDEENESSSSSAGEDAPVVGQPPVFGPLGKENKTVLGLPREIAEIWGLPVDSRDILTETSRNKLNSINEGVSMVHQLVKPPVLKTGTMDAILAFEKEYIKYVQHLCSFKSQGFNVNPMPLKSCINSGALMSICRFILKLPADGWKNVSEEQLRGILFGRATAMSQRERASAAKRVEKELRMDVASNKTLVDSVTALFEQLFTLLADFGLDPILSERRQCKLILGALKPPNLASAVNDMMETLEDWERAKKDLGMLRDLILQEAEYLDQIQSRVSRRQPDLPQRENTPVFSRTTTVVSESKPTRSRQRKKRGGGGGDANAAAEAASRPTQPNLGGRAGSQTGPAQQLPTTVVDKDRAFKEGRCFHCGNQGHRAFECPAHPGGSSAANETKAGGGGWRGGASRRCTEAGRPLATLGADVAAPFLMDSGADHSVITEEIYVTAKQAGAIRKEHVYRPVKKVQLANNATISVTKRVQANLTIETAAGPTCVKDVWFDVFGSGEEVIVGLPEWDSLSIPRPEVFLAQRAAASAGATTVTGRRVAKAMSVANEEAEDEDVVSRDDKETPIAGIASLTPDLGEALKQLLNRASEEGAPVEVTCIWFIWHFLLLFGTFS